MEDSRLKADRAGTKVRDGHGAAPEGDRWADREPDGSPEGCFAPQNGAPAAPAGFRTERDLLGAMNVLEGDLRGIHTFRALDNFRISGRATHPALIRAYLLVKKACAMANAETGWLDGEIADAICLAADEGIMAIDRATFDRSALDRKAGPGGTGTAAGAGRETVGGPTGGNPGAKRIAPEDFYLDALQGGEGTVPAPISPNLFYLDALQGGEGTVPAPITPNLFYLDALQGGAGTSTNMNVNEVLANRATDILRAARAARGESGYGAGDTRDERGTGQKGTEATCVNRLVDGPPPPLSRVDPLSHLNLHQSTNDTYPTALRVALIAKVRESAESAAALQGAFQAKEREFAQVVTTGRTEMQAAVPMTLGAIFSGFAEAAGRDRWRTFKCEERLRVVNLGGTAVGTALTAPRKYVFRATEILRGLTGYPLARAENLVDATANADALAEVAGIISARAANLTKAARDLRQLAAFGDIALPAVQAGSSIMPGKVNPVILESVIQAGMKARSECALACEAVAEGTLQINEFMPLIADSLLGAIDLATNASLALARHVAGIRANGAACAAAVNGNPIVATAFLPILGYEGVEALVKEWEARATNGGGNAEPTTETRDAVASFRDWLSRKLGEELVDRTLSPAALSALGHGERPVSGRPGNGRPGIGRTEIARTDFKRPANQDASGRDTVGRDDTGRDGSAGNVATDAEQRSPARNK